MLKKLRSFFVLVLFSTLIFSPFNCKKKEELKPEERAITPVPAKKEEHSGAVFTKDIFIYGGIKSLDDLTMEVSKIVSKVSPQMAAGIPMLIATGVMNNVLSVKNLDWLDGKKNVKFLNLNPKKYPKNMGLIFPVKNKDSFKSSLPDTKVEGKEGNLFSYSHPQGGEIYVNFVKDDAVFTNDPKVFADIKSYIEETLSKYEVKDFANVQLSIKGLREIFKDEIDAYTKKMTEPPQFQPQFPIPVRGLDKMMKEEISLLLSALEQMDSGELAISLKDETITLNANLKVIEGRGIANFLSSAQDKKVELYKEIPYDGWVAIAGNLEGKYFEKWSKLGIDFLTEILKLTDEEKNKIAELMKKSIELETGDFAFSMSSYENFPLTLITLTGVKDGKKYKEIVYDIYSMLFTKGVNFLKGLLASSTPEASKAIPSLKTENFKAFIDSIKPFLEKEGIRIALREETFKDASIDTLEFKIDWTKDIFKDISEKNEIQSIIGDKVGISFSYAKDKIIVSFGKKAGEDIKTLLEGKGKAGLTVRNIEKLLSKARGNLIFAGYFSIIEFFKSFKNIIPEFKDKVAMIEKMKEGEGISFIFSGVGTTLSAQIEVPLNEISEITKLNVPQPVTPSRQ